MTAQGRYSTLFLLLLSFLQVASAQQRVGVAGRLMDGEGTPIPFANVAAFSASDSSFSGGAASAENGHFFIPLKDGSYYLEISFLSYQTQLIKDVQVTGDVKRLGPITMNAETSTLNEMVVTADRNPMELRLDKRVFNVGKDLSNIGSNASEVLANVPSVDVDVDGNVSLRGSQSVRILIDGKPSGLVGASSTDALRLIPANLIERVEVITNPSARYDAEGEVGIINIVLKKEKRQGLNGSFELNTGLPHNHGASMNLNWRKKKFNLFANYGLRYQSRPGYGYSTQEYADPDTSYSFVRDREHLRSELSSLASVGTDFYISERDILTASVLYKISSGDNLAEVIYEDKNGLGEVSERILRDEVEREDEQDIETTLSYRKTFRSHEDHQWITEAKWTQNDDREKSDLVQTSSLPSVNELLQRSDNTEDERNYLFQSDYIRPFGSKARFETGVKATLREIRNDFGVEINEEGTWEQLPEFNNSLIYNEGIYAAYMILANEVKRFSYQLGLRGEYSDILTELVATGDRNARKYFNLFPSAHLSYKLSETRSLQLSYSRRLSRPSFRSLVPFFSYSDPRFFFGGNPDLDPEFTHSIESGLLTNWKKGSLLTSIYYRHTSGVIERITVTDSSSLIQRFPVNLGTRNSGGIEVNLSLNPSKKFRINASANAFYESIEGEFNGQQFSSEALTMTSRLMTMYELPKEIKLQVSGRYRAPRNTTQGRTLALYTIDIGLARDILKGKGTLSLSGKDILNSRIRRNIAETEFLDSYGEFQWRARQVVLSFNYRLNQRKKRPSMNGRNEGDFDM